MTVTGEQLTQQVQHDRKARRRCAIAVGLSLNCARLQGSYHQLQVLQAGSKQLPLLCLTPAQAHAGNPQREGDVVFGAVCDALHVRYSLRLFALGGRAKIAKKWKRRRADSLML